MTDHDFENELRSMLTQVEASATPSVGLDDRLTSAATQGLRTVHRVDVRHVRRFLPPLLAAAAVVVAVVVGAAVVNSSHASKQSPATHLPSLTGTNLPSPTVVTTPTPNTQSAVPPPVSTVAPGFVAGDVWFGDAQHGYALGDVPCSATLHYCATLLRTDNGGDAWSKVTLPQGLLPATHFTDGSCGTNGGISGPCIDRVLFADAQHGYLWSYNQLYQTSDGGQSWSHDVDVAADPTATHPQDLTVVGNHVIRVGPHHDCSSGCPVFVEVAAVGSNDWTDTTPAGSAPILGSRVIVAGDTAFLMANDGGSGPRPVTYYRTADGGSTWHMVSEGCGQYDAARGSSDGSLYQTCADQSGATHIERLKPGATVWGTGHALPSASFGSPDQGGGQNVTLSVWAATKISCFFYVATGSNTSISEAYLSTDDGVTWNRQVDGARWQVYGDDRGYRLRSDGKGIEVTTNAGDSFTTIGF